jgi:hypothetical protein
MSLFLHTSLAHTAPWDEIRLFLTANNVYESYADILPQNDSLDALRKYHGS